MLAAFSSLFAASVIGLGWQPMPDGSDRVEATLQIDRGLIQALADGESIPISVEVPEEAGRIGRVRLEVGSDTPVRTSLKPAVQRQPLPEGVVQTQHTTVVPVQPGYSSGNPLWGSTQQAAGQAQQYVNGAVNGAVNQGTQAVNQFGQQTSQAVQNAGSNMQDATRQFFNNVTGQPAVQQDPGLLQRAGQRFQEGVQAAGEPFRAGIDATRERLRGNQLQTGQLQNGQYPSGQTLSGQTPPGQTPPGQTLPTQYPRGEAPAYGSAPTGGQQYPQERSIMTQPQQYGQGVPGYPSQTGQGQTGQGQTGQGTTGVGSGELRQRLDREIRPGEAVGDWNSRRTNAPVTQQNTQPRYDARTTSTTGAAEDKPFWQVEPNYDQYRSNQNRGTASANPHREPAHSGALATPEELLFGSRDSQSQNRTQQRGSGRSSDGRPQLTRRGVEENSRDLNPVEIPPAAEDFRSNNRTNAEQRSYTQRGDYRPEDRGQVENNRTAQDRGPSASDLGWDTRDPRAQANQQQAGSDAPRAWFPLILAWVLLSGSVAGNFYLFWSYLDVRHKYRGVARQTSRVGHPRFAAA